MPVVSWLCRGTGAFLAPTQVNSYDADCSRGSTNLLIVEQSYCETLVSRLSPGANAVPALAGIPMYSDIYDTYCVSC